MVSMGTSGGAVPPALVSGGIVMLPSEGDVDSSPFGCFGVRFGYFCFKAERLRGSFPVFANLTAM